MDLAKIAIGVAVSVAVVVGIPLCAGERMGSAKDDDCEEHCATHEGEMVDRTHFGCICRIGSGLRTFAGEGN